MFNKIGIPMVLAIIILSLPINSTVWCGYEVNLNTSCEEQTLLLGTCSSYTVDIYLPDHTIKSTESLTQLNYTGVYYFIFSSSTDGPHKWIACDNSTGIINVKKTIEQQVAELNTTIITQNELANNTRTEIQTDIAGVVAGSGVSSSELNESLLYYSSIENQTRTQIIDVGNADWGGNITASTNNTAIAIAVWNEFIDCTLFDTNSSGCSLYRAARYAR